MRELQGKEMVKRILHVFPSYDGYGLGRYIDNVGREFIDRGYNLCFASSDNSDLRLKGKKFAIENRSRTVSAMHESAEKLRNILKKEKTGLIHAHTGVGALIGIMAGKAHGDNVPVVCTVHGWGLRKKEWEIKMDVKILNLTDGIIAVSKSVMEMLTGYGVERRLIAVAHNGFEPAKTEILNYPPPRLKQRRFLPHIVGRNTKRGEINGEAFVVGNVGRLVPDKNQILLLKAFSRFKRIVKNAVLVFVGDGEDRKELEELANKLKVSDSVIFTGWRTDAVSSMERFDVFVLPSVREPFGIVILEAMSLGIPVIGADSGGIPEIIRDGRDGLLFINNDGDSLFDRLFYIYKNKDRRIELGENGRKRAKLFSWSKTADKIERVYRQVLNETNKRKEQWKFGVGKPRLSM